MQVQKSFNINLIHVVRKTRQNCSHVEVRKVHIIVDEEPLRGNAIANSFIITIIVINHDYVEVILRINYVTL